MSDSGATARAHFERAFVATRYLLGHRRAKLTQGLQVRTSEAHRVATVLATGERQERAIVLAAEWGKVAVCLSRRGFSKRSLR